MSDSKQERPDTVVGIEWLADVREIVQEVAEGIIDEGEGLARCGPIIDKYKVKRGSRVTAAFNRLLKPYHAKIRDNSENSYTTREEASAIVNEFNNKYAVVNENGAAFIYEQTYDKVRERKVIVRITFENLRKLYLNRPVTITLPNSRTNTQTAADLWLSHPERQQYLGGVVFHPTNKHAPDQWNL
jgi:hypothetical protein